MKYVAHLPNMAPYLEQYVRYHGGTLKNGAIDLKSFTAAACMLRRNLIYFANSEAAENKWPQMVKDSSPSIGLDEFRHRVRKVDTEFSVWVLGPNGATEILEYLQAMFDMSLITEWTSTLAEYSETMSLPTKQTFVEAFCERHGIANDEREFRVVLKRMQRIFEKVSKTSANRSVMAE